MWEEGWSSPVSHCVRSFLLQAHTAINDTMKDQMRLVKTKYCNDVIILIAFANKLGSLRPELLYMDRRELDSHCLPSPQGRLSPLLLSYWTCSSLVLAGL